MKKKIKRLLIIPAKSKSSRIKNKNFKKFLGVPIIKYSYELAKKAKLFDKIHISTESIIVKKFLEKNKIYLDFLRDKKLTEDNVGLFEVYQFVIEEYEKKGFLFDEIWTLLPCSPLLEVKDLIRLKNKILKKELRKPIISICRYSAPIEWAFTMNVNNVLRPIDKKSQNLPSQKLKKKYFDVGTLSVFSWKNLKDNKKNFLFSGYELEPHKSIDIDEKQDWLFAEKLFKLKNKI